MTKKEIIYELAGAYVEYAKRYAEIADTLDKYNIDLSNFSSCYNTHIESILYIVNEYSLTALLEFAYNGKISYKGINDQEVILTDLNDILDFLFSGVE